MGEATRQVVLDTETTGLEASKGHRIIEIGCVEMVNRRITRNNLHLYINPEREVDEGAAAVHGMTWDDLRDKPTFAQIVDQFLDFCRGAEIIIHNASFDTGFLFIVYRRNHDLLQWLTNLDIYFSTKRKYHRRYFLCHSHPFFEVNVNERFYNRREHLKMNRLLFASQVMIQFVGIERCKRCKKLGNCHQTCIKSRIGCKLIIAHLLAPETLSVQTNIPIA